VGLPFIKHNYADQGKEGEHEGEMSDNAHEAKYIPLNFL
jgi:hypothetical protein